MLEEVITTAYCPSRKKVPSSILPLLLVVVGEAKSEGDEDALRLTRGGRRWLLLPGVQATPRLLTLPWALSSPSEISKCEFRPPAEICEGS